MPSPPMRTPPRWRTVAIRLQARRAVIADPAGLSSLRDRLVGHRHRRGRRSRRAGGRGRRTGRHRALGDRRRRGASADGRRHPGRQRHRARQQGVPGLRRRALHGARPQSMASASCRSIRSTMRSTSSSRAATGASIRTYTLTASGGPFRTWPAERIAAATPAAGAQSPGLVDGRENHDRLRDADEQGPRTH